MPTLALLGWIIIAPIIAAQLTAVQIVIWLTLIPYLFLPEAFAINLPGLPDIDKTAAISIGLLLSFLFHRRKFDEVKLPGKRARMVKFAILACFVLMVVGSLLTLQTNREPLFYGPVVLPGMRPWDVVSTVSGIVFYTLPFFFAVRYLAAPGAHRELLSAFVVMGLLYSLLMLIEIRLSPQLHTWAYGYFQHSFGQHIRGGFRPIVFLQHGIWVGFFTFMTVMSALGLWRATKDPKWILAALWLFLILMISKNLGATAICLLCAGVFLFVGRRFQTVFAVSIAMIVLLYPIVRQAHFMPIDRITSLVAMVSEPRAQSVQFRFYNEDQLLARASQKPLAGWGGYNREKIFNEQGRLLSVPDGLWIITIGTRGWVGYIALFGVLSLPITFLFLLRNKATPPPETMALVSIITGNLIYLIPNATLTPISWLAFGAFVGYLRYYTLVQNPLEKVASSSASSRGPVMGYTRFPVQSKSDQG